ncbi:MAG: mechanosensitive ion channel family protein [Myxococcota bacterium]
MDTTALDTSAVAETSNAVIAWVMSDGIVYGGKALGALVILVILVIGLIAANFVRGMVTRSCDRAKLDKALSTFLGQMARWAVITMAVVAMFQTVAVQVTSFVAVLASVGFAIGLALQGSLGHFASGILLLVFRPINIDELVDVAGQTGFVREIGLFATQLVTPDQRLVTVPNGTITGSTIVNYSRLGRRRADVPIGVAYGTDLRKVEEVVVAAARSVPEVTQDEPIGFAFTEMAASNINFVVMPMCTADDYLTVLHKVRSACYVALEEAGIEIPFDQVVMHQAPTGSSSV